MSAFAASTWARMFVPSAVRAALDRQACVQNPLVVTLQIAALSFSCADFPLLGPVSQLSSSTGVALKAASACFLWHLITAGIALAKALAMASAHLLVAATFGAEGLSLLPGTHPVSSVA